MFKSSSLNLFLVSIFLISSAMGQVLSSNSRVLKKKTNKNKTLKSKKSNKASASRPVTAWWVLFNKPSACTGGDEESTGIKCALSDLMGAAMSGTNEAMISVFYATGGVADETGFLRLVASLYKTQGMLNLLSDSDDHYVWGGPPPLYSNAGFSLGYNPAEMEDTEVHIVLHDHGPPADNTDDLVKQLLRFNDPLCGQFEGPNTCVDAGVAAFSVMTDDGKQSKDVMPFPMFPEGCAASGDCTEMQEAVQIQTGMVTLLRAGGGDVLQIVAELHLPTV